MKKALGFSVLIAALLLVVCLFAPSGLADQNNMPRAGITNYQGLPDGYVNVVLPSVEDHIGGGDYGLINLIPVEVVGKGPKAEVRVARSPELYLGYSRKLSCEIKLGKIEEIYYWIETPPVGARWAMSMVLVYPDGSRRELRTSDMKPGVRQWIPVDPDTVLSFTLKVTSDFKLSRHVVVTVSPTSYSVFPDDSWPQPYRTYWE